MHTQHSKTREISRGGAGKSRRRDPRPPSDVARDITETGTTDRWSSVFFALWLGLPPFYVGVMPPGKPGSQLAAP